MPVIAILAIFQGQISINDGGNGLAVQSGQFPDDLFKVHGDRGGGRVFFPDMGIIKQVDQVLIDLVSGTIYLVGNKASSKCLEELSTIIKG